MDQQLRMEFGELWQAVRSRVLNLVRGWNIGEIDDLDARRLFVDSAILNERERVEYDLLKAEARRRGIAA